MPSLLKQHGGKSAGVSLNEPTQTQQFTRILVELTRKVWHPDCTFETAIGVICTSAAEALGADRISIWQREESGDLLRCIQLYDASAGTHIDPSRLEALPLAGGEYVAAMKQVRSFDAGAAEELTESEPVTDAMFGYLRRHRVRSLLDAPAMAEGELLAVISHESIDRSREWSEEEATFAASMGDYVAMAYEISRRRAAEAEVEHLRLHDGATGLPNRDYMVEVARQRMAGDGEPAIAVVHIRVDSFNGIATTAEAPTTDEVMGALARRMRRLQRTGIELARVRSDGLAFLVSGHMGERRVIQLAEQALLLVQDTEWVDASVAPSAAAGVAFAEPGMDSRVLLRQAEEAAEHARSGHKFRYEVYEEGHHDALVESLRFERELRDAFAEGQFEVHYQPEYDAHDRRWTAAEALVRRRHQGQLVSAADFIGVAESSGLILPLGSWVLHQACRDAAAWPVNADGSGLAVRINVSARQFDESDLANDVRLALAGSGLAAGRLSLEVTETTLMRDVDHAKSLLDQIKAMGVGVALDDFGTGYASLTYLKALPIDVLKIDRSFVQCLPSGVVDTAIVQAVVGLAGSLGIDVVAEGVELEEQHDALLAMGVRRMQGWRYGKAMPQAEWCDLLAAPKP